MTITLNAASGITTPSPVVVQGSTSGAITLAAPAVAGTNTVTFPAGTGTVAVNGVSSNIVSGTAQTVTSGSSIDFTGIPSWVKRITVMINGLSFAAGGAGVIQIGSGSLTTTGYSSNTTNLVTTPSIGFTSVTNGFGTLTTGAAATTINAQCVLTTLGSNIWLYQQISQRIGDSVTNICTGSITLGSTLDRLSLVATTSTFDAGTVNILYE